ncbi:MAG: ribonuclease H-like domain-containing protein [Melioribacteraceae bacterium]|nr:ribonuclease H-like domain-containing protein [Melioribacteraceae bacterium]
MEIVFDIETVGCEFDSLKESQQEFLLRYAEMETDEEKKDKLKEEVKRNLSLYPFTAKVIAIGLLNVEKEKLLVLYESNKKDEWKNEDGNITYKSMTEVEMLKSFWMYAEKTKKLISFNGRSFDLPFLMIRSAINKIKPTKNYLKNRFDSTNHVDLLEQLTFYGLTKKFNLDFYCNAFGIESPKSKGITGMEVKEMYKAGLIEDIAVYCGKDVQATYLLYKIWNEYLNIS